MIFRQMEVDDSETEMDFEENQEKLLTFTTGSRSFSPHEIGRPVFLVKNFIMKLLIILAMRGRMSDRY